MMPNKILIALVVLMVAWGCSPREKPDVASGGSVGQYGQSSGGQNQATSTSAYSNGAGPNAYSTSGSSAGGAAQGALINGRRYFPADLKNPDSILAKRVIYFEYDRHRVQAQFRPALDAHAALLRAFPDLQVRLEGHADERGSREYNIALSERRAKAVRDYLLVKGMDKRQAELVGYGEEIPESTGTTQSDWNKNRRVELIYVGH